jgi:acyl carrier protein
MSDTTTIELKNIDPEDISDVLVNVEKSFGFKFGDTELKDVKTFGELCDIITNKVQGDNVNDCTTQQGFYKLRNAIAATQVIDKDSITTDTNLQQLFPRHSRIQKIKELQNELDMTVDILDINAWLGWSIFIGIAGSLIMFFFNWKFALSGLTFFMGTSWTAYKFFAKEFKLATVGQLTEKLTRENYLKSRRNSSTINRNEISKKVKEFFSEELDLEEEVLTRQATFV